MKHFFTIFVFVFLLSFYFSSAQVNWTKYEDNPVLDTGSPGEWDDQIIGMPSVLFDGSVYHMWFSASNISEFKNIGYATSEDGINWTKYNDPSTTMAPYTESDPVLIPGSAGSWDDVAVSAPCVLLIDTVYHMWYTGRDVIATNGHHAIGHATSEDGVNWVEDTNNPVLDVGSNGAWDDVWIYGPSVIYDGNTYHMWYNAWGGNDNQLKIGHATSDQPDGVWTKDAGNPVLSFEAGKWDYPRLDGAEVVLNDSLFYMWYSGGNTFSWQIGFATSENGSDWEKYVNNPVLSQGISGAWDDVTVGFCSVLYDPDSSIYKMWYSGSPSSWTGRIGYATVPLTILNVPAQYATIQEGIDAAEDGQVVLVDEGTYYENINFKGKAITIASQYWFDGDTSHISKTIIDGSMPSNPDSGSVVFMVSGEDTTSVLCGLTITGGSGTYDPGVDGYGGAGINMFGLGSSGGKIIHNRIINNTLLSDSKVCGGAGIMALFIEPDRNLVIEYNEIKNNIVSGPVSNQQGGGIYCKWISKTGYIRIKNNIITKNSVTCTGSYKAIAGGIGLSMNLSTVIDAVVENNIITHNELHCQAGMGAGIYVVYWNPDGQFTDTIPTPIIQNNIIAHNYSQDRGAGIGIWTVQKNKTANPSSEDYPQAAIINNTIVNNKANDGCGIFNFDSYPLLMNNILWNDLSVEGSREIFNDDIAYPGYTESNEGELNIYYSDIQGGWEGEGNINRHPGFEDSLFNLSDTSWCVGNGVESVEINNILYTYPATDYFYNPRPHNIDSFVDMGAIESHYGQVTSLEKSQKPLPQMFALSQNYPNPFNPKTVIRYALPVTCHSNLSVYNILGQKVVTLVNKKQPAGNYQVKWKASGLSSGVYLYRLQAGNHVQTKKMILMK